MEEEQKNQQQAEEEIEPSSSWWDFFWCNSSSTSSSNGGRIQQEANNGLLGGSSSILLPTLSSAALLRVAPLEQGGGGEEEIGGSCDKNRADNENDDNIRDLSPSRLTWEQAVARLLKCDNDEQQDEKKIINVQTTPSGFWDTALSALLRSWSPSSSSSRTLTHRPPPPALIRHIRQEEIWDCGIACMQMIFNWLEEVEDKDIVGGSGSGSGGDFESLTPDNMPPEQRIRRKAILDAINTQSVWTVDLVLLLDRYIKGNKNLLHVAQHRQPNDYTDNDVNTDTDTSYLFCSTSALRVNENLHNYAYYEKDYNEDKIRVNRIFEVIQKEKLPVFQLQQPKQGDGGGCDCEDNSTSSNNVGLTMSEVIRLISKPNCIALALVDNSILKPKERTTTGDGGGAGGHGHEHNNNGCNDDDSTYAGHYIILTGANSINVDETKFDDEHDEMHRQQRLVIVNPASSEPTSLISYDHFERAWRASGTDEDIIFICKHY